MRFRNILAILSSASAEAATLRLAEKLAAHNAGRVSAVVAGWMPEPVGAEGWIASPVWGDVRKEMTEYLLQEADHVRQHMGDQPWAGPVDTELFEMQTARTDIAARARHFDITVMSRPQNDAGHAMTEGALFASGRPVLIAPPQWNGDSIGKTVVVCWKPTREAARALTDAEDIIAHASRVMLLSVDPVLCRSSNCAEFRPALAGHFARRSQAVQFCDIVSLGRSEARSVLDHAHAIDADLIVMGAYGRSRMSEFVFGGMTREMLKTATIPVLMSH